MNESRKKCVKKKIHKVYLYKFFARELFLKWNIQMKLIWMLLIKFIKAWNQFLENFRHFIK